MAELLTLRAEVASLGTSDQQGKSHANTIHSAQLAQLSASQQAELSLRQQLADSDAQLLAHLNASKDSESRIWELEKERGLMEAEVEMFATQLQEAAQEMDKLEVSYEALEASREHAAASVEREDLIGVGDSSYGPSECRLCD